MRCRAPGKLILLGEYAVLHGGLSLVVGVDRFAECSVTNQSELVIHSPLHGTLSFPTADGETIALPFAKELVARRLSQNLTLSELSGRYHLDSQGFYEVDAHGSTTKLGLGSSAASTVALAGALTLREGLPLINGLDTIYGCVQETHRTVQGLGSGADVAASTFGGVLAYRWLDKQPGLLLEDLLPESNQPEPTAAQFHIETSFGDAHISRMSVQQPLVAVWTGHAADTKTLVRATRQFSHTHEDLYRRLMVQLADCSQSGITAWHSDSRTALMDSMENTTHALRELGSQAGVALVTQTHDALSRQAASLNAVAKPTGAGGGDLAWVLGPETMEAVELVERLKEMGLNAICLEIPGHGLHSGSGDA